MQAVFQAIAITAAARLTFPLFGNYTERAWVPSSTQPYFVHVQRDIAQTFPDHPTPETEMIMLQVFQYGNYLIRWGYGPKSDVLIVAEGYGWTERGSHD